MKESKRLLFFYNYFVKKKRILNINLYIIFTHIITIILTEIISIFLSVKPIHYLLAYFGMIIHTLAKYAEFKNHNKEYDFLKYLNENIVTIITSIITIPVLLLIIADTTLKDVTPITNVTAIFAGYQTQDVFKFFMNIYGKKRFLINSDKS